MKKQINPTIKAHLIRGAFYLLLLLAVCAIPFALAQRNAAKRSVAKPSIQPNVTANKDFSRATGPATLPGRKRGSREKSHWADSASHVADSPGQ